MARPFIPVPGTVGVELIYYLSVVPVLMENTFHVAKTGAWTLAQIQALRAAFDGWDNVNGKTIRHGNVVLQRIRIKSLESDAAPVEDYTLPTPRAGTVGSSAASPTSGCIALKAATGLTGRSQRGRIYVPVLSSSQSFNIDQINQTFANQIITAYAALLAQITNVVGDSKLVVTSFRHNNAWREVGQNTPIINYTFVDLYIDSQRRRLYGRGAA